MAEIDSGRNDELMDIGSRLCLSPECSPKLLEEPAVYNRATDELYFVSNEAFDFLIQCGQSAGVADPVENDFIETCLQENILIPGSTRPDRIFAVKQSPLPSLRYLLLHINDRCNLKCRHCFIGESGQKEISLEDVVLVADELEAMQGLRLMVSGGEPLLHRDFRAIDDYLAGKDLRVILMTNGTLLDERVIARLCVEEVQVSLDGMKQAHEQIRGPGTFDRTLEALRLLREAGIDASVATMIHSGNLNDFEVMAELMQELEVREWSVDLPSPSGRMNDNRELLVSPEQAAPLLDYSYGGAIHEPLPGFACGSHLMAVMADGSVARCGFYADEPVGTIAEGLAACWQKVPRVPLASLQCDCQFLASCRGGCRFRATCAGEPSGADLCQCYRYGVI